MLLYHVIILFESKLINLIILEEKNLYNSNISTPYQWTHIDFYNPLYSTDFFGVT